jgi:uncharacterized protein YjbJ (UPF0337 family)
VPAPDPGTPNPMSDGTADDMKGRAKKAAGELTNDDSLKR